MEKDNLDNVEVKYGGKISNRYGNKSVILGLNINKYVSIKAVCDEIVTDISDVTMDRTRICGDVVDYTYYVMRSYPYGPDTPYMTVLNREKYLDPVDVKPGKLYTMTVREKDLPFIMVNKELYDKTIYVFGSSSLLHITGFKQVLLYDKDVMPKDHHYGILDEKAMSMDASKVKECSIGLFNAETIIY